MDDVGDIDLDVLRGWSERRDGALCADHAMAPMARLVAVDAGDVEPIYGPDVLVGRYHPQYGPVDVILGGLADHQNYRIGAPHLRLRLDDQQWMVHTISPGVDTAVDGHVLDGPDRRRAIDHGDVLVVGVVRYRFETGGRGVDQWRDERAELMEAADGPALFLCRRGGPCGPFKALDATEAVVLGRSFPAPGELGATDWPGQQHRPDWDLAGLRDRERKHIGFEHAAITAADDHWEVDIRAERKKVFVNRAEIDEPTPLSGGDELALGAVTFAVYDPAGTADGRPSAIDPPAVVDWQEDSTPIIEEVE